MKLTYLLGLALVVTITVGSGYLAGRMTNRWGQSADMAAAARAVEGLPKVIGPWHAEHSGELTEEVVRMLQCAGYISRTYINPETGKKVTVAVLVGPAQPIATHTPEVCYSSRDYKLLERAQRETLALPSGEAAELWSVTLGSRGDEEHVLRVYYGWSDGGPWKAPDNPRFAFRGEPVLYKVQIASYLAPGRSAGQNDAGRDFLVEFLPLVHKAIETSSS